LTWCSTIWTLNKTGRVKYNQFCLILEEKYKKLDPYGELKNKVISELNNSGKTSPQTEKTFHKKEKLEDYKDPSPYHLLPFTKTQKKMNCATGDKNYYGVENIKGIVNHEFEKEFIEAKAKKEEDQIISLIMKEQNLRGMETKASIMRNKAIKDKILMHESKEKSPFRLKQFDEVLPSNYISQTTKGVKKRYNLSSKRSHIETESVLKVASLTAQSNKDGTSVKKSEDQKIYLGEKELESLSKTGAEIHRFDMRKDKMMEAK